MVSSGLPAVGVGAGLRSALSSALRVVAAPVPAGAAFGACRNRRRRGHRVACVVHLCGQGVRSAAQPAGAAALPAAAAAAPPAVAAAAAAALPAVR